MPQGIKEGENLVNAAPQEDPIRTATRPALVEARRRVVELAVDLDAVRGRLTAVRDALPSRTLHSSNPAEGPTQHLRSRNRLDTGFTGQLALPAAVIDMLSFPLSLFKVSDRR